MIVVHGHVTVAEGKLAEALALSLEHVARSRAEPGCLAHGVHRDAENPARLVFVEQWVDHAAFLQHIQVPASRNFARSLASLASEPPGLDVYEAARLPLPGRGSG